MKWNDDLLVLVRNTLFETIQIERVSDVLIIHLCKRDQLVNLRQPGSRKGAKQVADNS